jgi:glutaminyl-peptide cyclotransferase
MTMPASRIAVAALLLAGCDEADSAHARQTESGAGRRPALVRSPTTPETRAYIVRELPHDTAAFTQGLALHDEKLYESTGLYGSSSLRRIDPATGDIDATVRLPRKFFGEGIAILGDRLYQLTWKTGIAIAYDLATLTPTDTFRYAGEGWGLTSLGDSLIMSDGTSRLRLVDPANFRVIRTIDVTDGGTPVKLLNELERIDGEIWANVWRSGWIARIDPASGQVRAWVDLRDVWKADPRGTEQNVPNGIAYDSAARRILVTGKRWAGVYVVDVR